MISRSHGNPAISAPSPIPIPAVEPETEEEQRRYDGALRRRQLALILSGKMKPEDAHELKALFLPREDAE